jgi:threonine dehydrogenase-like Zn-dependent dehydrogenase
MKAFRFYKPEDPLVLEELPLPKIDEGSVLVKVKGSGICGTDLHYKHGRQTPSRIPATLGHEIAGIVERVGSGVTDLVEGDRVVVHYFVSCGACSKCDIGQDNKCSSYRSFGQDIDGGFAEYTAVPARNAFKLPKEVPFDQGAVIGCAVSTAFHSLRVGQTSPGDRVAVFGLGGVGMNVVQCAKAFGASKIIGVDTIESKLQLAKQLGADETINAGREDPLKVIMDVTNGLGVDVALECAGHPKTMEWTLKSVEISRRAGYPSPFNGRAIRVAQYYDTITLAPGMLSSEGGLRHSSDHTRDDLRRVIDLVRAGRIDVGKVISHRIPFTDLNKGIDLLDSHGEGVMRVVAIQ